MTLTSRARAARVERTGSVVLPGVLALLVSVVALVRQVRWQAHQQKMLAQRQAPALAAQNAAVEQARASAEIAETDTTGRLALAALEDAGETRDALLAEMRALRDAHAADRRACRDEIDRLISKVAEAESAAARATVRANEAEDKAAAAERRALAAERRAAALADELSQLRRAALAQEPRRVPHNDDES